MYYIASRTVCTKPKDKLSFTHRDEELQIKNHRRFLDIILKVAAPACVIGPFVMVAADVLTIALNRNIDPIKQSISGFAAGPYGWIEKIGMLTVAISFLFISLNLLAVKDGQESNTLKLSGVLLLIVALGFFMTSLFDTRVAGTPASVHGLIHRVSLDIVSVAFYPFNHP